MGSAENKWRASLVPIEGKIGSRWSVNVITISMGHVTYWHKLVYYDSGARTGLTDEDYNVNRVVVVVGVLQLNNKFVANETGEEGKSVTEGGPRRELSPQSLMERSEVNVIDMFLIFNQSDEEWNEEKRLNTDLAN